MEKRKTNYIFSLSVKIIMQQCLDNYLRVHNLMLSFLISSSFKFILCIYICSSLYQFSNYFYKSISTCSYRTTSTLFAIIGAGHPYFFFFYYQSLYLYLPTPFLLRTKTLKSITSILSGGLNLIFLTAPLLAPDLQFP